MSTVHCELRTHSAALHLQQLFTGFSSLARKGVIDLTERLDASATRPQDWTLTAFIRGRAVVYDVADNHRIDEQRLEAADFYFKRSFHESYVASLGAAAAKVHPLGLNYEVYPSHFDVHGARRNFLAGRGTRRLSGALKALGLGPGFMPRQPLFEDASDHRHQPRVLFLTRAWDPNDSTDRGERFLRQREKINDMRAQCIERLRRHFGDRVLAGFAHTEFASRHYSSLLVADPRISRKDVYLTTVRESDICITTTGLHGSIGWKLGEYVALGKAIVSERLEHTVPGRFAAGVNYLEFRTPEDCVAMTDELFCNPGKRQAMRARNRAYYEHYLRPDQLVLNTLSVVLGRHVVTALTRGFAGDAVVPARTRASSFAGD